MLKIQVLGSGVIPRKGFLAPHKEPFPAELQEIGLILRESRLSINYLNPDTGEFVPLTRKNLMSVWNKYGKRRPVRASKMAPQTAPATPSVPEDRKIETPATQTAPQDDIIISKASAEPKITEPEVPEPVNEEVTVVEEVKETVTEKVTETPSKMQPGDIVISSSKNETKNVVIEDKVVVEDKVEENESKSDTFTPQYSKKKRR